MAACSRSAPPPVATQEVEGTLSLGGKPRVITACEVAPRGGSVELRLHLDDGVVVSYAEAERRFLVDDKPYRCTAGAAHDIMFGPGFFHGALDFVCDPLEGHLRLRCGAIDEATRARMQQEIQKARGSQ
jgi:hypothetical protein